MLEISFKCEECGFKISVDEYFYTVLRAFGRFPWACNYCHTEYIIHYSVSRKAWVYKNTHTEGEWN